MAKKTVQLGMMAALAQVFMEHWEEEKGNIKLNGKSMYALIGLRNIAQQQYRQIQESALALARAAGGEEQPNGAVKVPDDKVDEVNNELNDIQNGDFELEYTPIIIGDNDSLPLVFMDALYDYIELK